VIRLDLGDTVVVAALVRILEGEDSGEVISRLAERSEAVKRRPWLFSAALAPRALARAAVHGPASTPG